MKYENDFLRYFFLIRKKHNNKVELADKPGSVEDNHSSRTIVTNRLKQPTRLLMRVTWSGDLFGLAPSGVYLAITVTSKAVRSYRTFSPLPVFRRIIGGLLSVALSISSRFPGVTWHSALRSPDFPL